jgi:hypothetical protein
MGINMTEKKGYIVFCGIDCSECPAYKATKEDDTERLAELAEQWSTPEMRFEAGDLVCDGCHGPRTFRWCGECPVRLCGIERGLENCAQCEDYPCGKLEEAWRQMGEAAAVQRANLERFRGG